MKKLIAKILIIITLITFIIPKYSYATEESNSQGEYNVHSSLAESGRVNVNGRLETITDTPSEGSAIAAILSAVSAVFAFSTNALLSACINEDRIDNFTNFTIAALVSGEYDILNNDFLLKSYDDNSSNTNKDNNSSNTNKIIKESVSAWYYAIRNLSIIISLFVLIYIGIRMAISTLAEDKAKYKKMIIAWIQSFILIFLLHYIMIAAMAIQNALMKVILNAVGSVDGAAEREIVATCFKAIPKTNGWTLLWYTILYWVMTYYQVKFFFLYAKRMIATAFLIVIAPLITVTYSIDKVGDNKAQAFETWLKEYIVNIFIQPVHLVIYIVFIMSASELAVVVPLFTIVFFGALSRGEKIIKGIFGMRKKKSINSIGRK